MTRSVSRSFKVGDMLLVRIPGLQSKLEGCWQAGDTFAAF